MEDVDGDGVMPDGASRPARVPRGAEGSAPMVPREAGEFGGSTTA